MKRLLILFVMLSMSFTTSSDEFCRGWDRGYAEGWCYEIYGCVAPVPPVCPVPQAGFERYTDGYNRGFSQALEDRK
jgi:hypothetical protein